MISNSYLSTGIAYVRESVPCHNWGNHTIKHFVPCYVNSVDVGGLRSLFSHQCFWLVLSTRVIILSSIFSNSNSVSNDSKQMTIYSFIIHLFTSVLIVPWCSNSTYMTILTMLLLINIKVRDFILQSIVLTLLTTVGLNLKYSDPGGKVD